MHHLDIMKKLWLQFTIIVLTLGFVLPVSAQVGIQKAGNNLSTVAEQGAGITESNLGNVVGTVINAALSLIGLIFLVLMVYAGFMWMTAQGDEAKVDKAKDIIRAAIIGLVITISAYAITYFVTSKFEGGTPLSGDDDSNGSGGAGGGNLKNKNVYCLNKSISGTKVCVFSTDGTCPASDNSPYPFEADCKADL